MYNENKIEPTFLIDTRVHKGSPSLALINKIGSFLEFCLNKC